MVHWARGAASLSRVLATGGLVVALSFVSVGCAAVLVGAAGGAAGTVYVMGKLEDEVRSPVMKVYQAAIAGLKELEMPILENNADKLSAHVESAFSDDTSVWININSLSPNWSQLTIRVGWFGDEARSQTILESIEAHLK